MEGNNHPRHRLAALNVKKNRQTARWMYYISSGSSINRRRNFTRRYWMQGPICVPSGVCIGSSRTPERFVNAATNCGIRSPRSRNYRARSRNQIWSWWDITKFLGPPNGRTVICTSSSTFKAAMGSVGDSTLSANICLGNTISSWHVTINGQLIGCSLLGQQNWDIKARLTLRRHKGPGWSPFAWDRYSLTVPGTSMRVVTKGCWREGSCQGSRSINSRFRSENAVFRGTRKRDLSRPPMNP